MTPEEYCIDKAAPAGSTLHYALLFVPPPQRRALVALHALSRELDEAADKPEDPQVALASLAWWRQELSRLPAGSPQHPVTRALLAAMERFDISAAALAALVGAREKRLDQQRFADFASLEKHCHDTCDAMALVSAGICGYRDSRTADHAVRLGIADCLANFIRNMGEHVRRNRLYVPVDELQRFEVPAADLLNLREGEKFSQLMAFQADRVERLYEEALGALPAEDRRSQHPGLILAAIAREELAEIRRRHFPVLSQRTALTPLRKLWIACRTRLGA